MQRWREEAAEAGRCGGDDGFATMPTFKPQLLQYLFNAPEGLSRLALEHKARPTARLRAALVTTLATRGAVSCEMVVV